MEHGAPGRPEDGAAGERRLRGEIRSAGFLSWEERIQVLQEEWPDCEEIHPLSQTSTCFHRGVVLARDRQCQLPRLREALFSEDKFRPSAVPSRGSFLIFPQGAFQMAHNL